MSSIACSAAHSRARGSWPPFKIAQKKITPKSKTWAAEHYAPCSAA